jgi:hypothetical protein
MRLISKGGVWWLNRNRVWSRRQRADEQQPHQDQAQRREYLNIVSKSSLFQPTSVMSVEAILNDNCGHLLQGLYQIAARPLSKNIRPA